MAILSPIMSFENMASAILMYAWECAGLFTLYICYLSKRRKRGGAYTLMSVLMRVFYSLMILVDGHSCRWSNVHQATRPREHFSPQVVAALNIDPKFCSYYDIQMSGLHEGARWLVIQVASLGIPRVSTQVRYSLIGLVVHKSHVSSNPKNMKGQHSGMKR